MSAVLNPLYELLQSGTGCDRPIAFAFRTLAPAEKKYAQIDRQGLAIVFGVTTFRKYIYGRDFKIESDHNMSLMGIMSEEKLIYPLASASIQRRALTLSNYQYHLRYKQGAQNTNSDALSRLPVPTPAMEVPVPTKAVLSLSVVNDTPIIAARIAKWRARDPLLSAVQIMSVKAGHQTLLKILLCSTNSEMISHYSKFVSRGDLASSFRCLVVNVC